MWTVSLLRPLPDIVRNFLAGMMLLFRDARSDLEEGN